MLFMFARFPSAQFLHLRITTFDYFDSQNHFFGIVTILTFDRFWSIVETCLDNKVHKNWQCLKSSIVLWANPWKLLQIGKALLGWLSSSSTHWLWVVKKLACTLAQGLWNRCWVFFPYRIKNPPFARSKTDGVWRLGKKSPLGVWRPASGARRLMSSVQYLIQFILLLGFIYIIYIWGRKLSSTHDFGTKGYFWGFANAYVSKCRNRRRRNMVDSAFKSWWSIFSDPQKILVIRTHPEELHVLKCIGNTRISTIFSKQWD